MYWKLTYQPGPRAVPSGVRQQLIMHTATAMTAAQAEEWGGEELIVDDWILVEMAGHNYQSPKDCTPSLIDILTEVKSES